MKILEEPTESEQIKITEESVDLERVKITEESADFERDMEENELYPNENDPFDPYKSIEFKLKRDEINSRNE